MKPKAKRDYAKWFTYLFIFLSLGVVGFATSTTVIDPLYVNTTGEFVADTGTYSGGVTCATLNTGQGAYELYAMNQDVETTDAVTFSTVNTGQGANELYAMNQDVETTDAVTFSTVNTGHGANELYDMDQNVQTSDDVTFSTITADVGLNLGGVTRNTWTEAAPSTVSCSIQGGTYLATTFNGTELYSGASAYTALQTALNYTTLNSAGNEAFLKGRLYNHSAVTVSSGVWDIGANQLAMPNRVTFSGAGREATRIKGSHASNVIIPMWSNMTYGVAIYDMRIDGSSVAIPINWSLSDATLPSGETYGWGLLDLQRLHLTGYDEYSFYWWVDNGNNAVLHINDVRAQGKWYLWRMFDSTITMFQCSEMIIKDSSASQISHGYIGGGHNYNLRIYDGSAANDNYDLTFDNIIFDNPLQSCVSIEDYAENIIFDACTFSNLNWNALNDTYSAFVIEGNADHVSIVGSQFTSDLNYKRWSSTYGRNNPPSTWKYLIEEQAGTHNNTYLGNRYADNSRLGVEVWDRATGNLIYTTTPLDSYWERPVGTSHGQAEASNDDWIEYSGDWHWNESMDTLTILVTVQESDSAYAAQVKNVNSTHFQLYLYDIVAAEAETTDKTIDWSVYYEPNI